MANPSSAAQTQTDSKPTSQERVALLKEKLKEGLARLETDDDWKSHLKSFAKVGPLSPMRYSFNNQVLLLVQAEERAEQGAALDLSAVATFEAWKRAGRLVKKGEKAVWILKPYIVKDRKRLDALRAKQGSVSKEEEDACKFIGYSLMPVFAINQTDGEALPETTLPAIEEDKGWATAIQALRAVALKDGIPSIEFRARRLGEDPGALGWCMTSGDRSIVVITDGQSRAEQFSTGVHELAHAMLHCKDGKKDKHEYASNEVEAESIAYIVCGALDLDTSGCSFGYVKGWATRAGVDPIKQVEASGRKIVDTACRILDALAGIERRAEVEA